ncbi:MAG: tRNA (adenosine(37)-N6)-threonylcarbamoyltransferase complex dimerization subunit type 1 TsaB [Microbacter sp.]
MPIILHLETSTSVCSTALSIDGKLHIRRMEHHGPSHAVLLATFVDEILKQLRQENIRPDAVAVSSGPGSYTGLRIGVSMAKGLCFGWNVPLIAVDTLKLLAVSALAADQSIDESTLLCPMIDARRMEVYSAIYNSSLEPIRSTTAEIVEHDTYLLWLEEHPMLFFGNGAEKCRNLIQHPNARFLNDIVPDAAQMISLAEKAFFEQKFENTAYFEPFYLKDFIATTPKNKLF